jgi:hypothetical protein
LLRVRARGQEDISLAPPNGDWIAAGVDRYRSAIHRATVQLPRAAAELGRRAEGLSTVIGTDQVHIPVAIQHIPKHDEDPPLRIDGRARMAALAHRS